jgi:IS5 family transposase
VVQTPRGYASVRSPWARTVARIKAAGRAVRTRTRDRRRSAGLRARSIASKLRLRGQQQRDQAQAAVRRITGELAGIDESSMREAAAVLRNAKRALRGVSGQRKAQLQQAISHLNTILGRTERVVAQTRSRLAGVMPESLSRLVSLHDVDARRQRRRGHPRPQPAPRSNGEPDPKAGSTTSNEATAGTAPNSPASMAPEPGAGTAYSHTTSSR